MANTRKLQPRDQWVVNDANQVVALQVDGISRQQLIRSQTMQLTGNRDALPGDDGNILANNTASNYTITIQKNMGDNFGFAMIQGSTGTCTVAAGTDVTLIGSTLATTNAGDLLAVIWVSDNSYVVKVS